MNHTSGIRIAVCTGAIKGAIGCMTCIIQSALFLLQVHVAHSMQIFTSFFIYIVEAYWDIH